MHRFVRVATLALPLAFVAILPVQAATIFLTDLSGAEEVPPNSSPAFGFSMVTLSDDEATLTVEAEWTDLTSPAVAGHIHCCAPPGAVAPPAIGFPGLPPGMTATYGPVIVDLFDPTTYAPPFLTAAGTVDAARVTLVAGLFSGLAYVNIHSEQFPAGEIRGQLAAVPEPASLALLGLGATILARFSRRPR